MFPNPAVFDFALVIKQRCLRLVSNQSDTGALWETEMKEEQFKVVAGKRRQHSLNLGDEKIKELRKPRQNIFQRMFAWLFAKKNKK